MRNGQFDKFSEKMERDVQHMLNNGNRRDKVIRYIVNRMEGENTIFTSRQIGNIFRMIL